MRTRPTILASLTASLGLLLGACTSDTDPAPSPTEQAGGSEDGDDLTREVCAGRGQSWTRPTHHETQHVRTPLQNAAVGAADSGGVYANQRLPRSGARYRSVPDVENRSASVCRSVGSPHWQRHSNVSN